MLLSSIGRPMMDFLRDESGAAQIEYALIGALVSVGTIATLYNNGQELIDLFDIVAANTEPLPATPPSR